MWVKRKQSGFTIVELLIVIVVIGILATIVIVAFSGVQSRARFVKMQTDIITMKKYIEAYNAINGTYPTTGGVWKFQRQDGTGFIPGLVPSITANLSSITDGPTGALNNNTYIYQSNGTDYKLDRLYQPNLLSDEWSQVPASMKDQSFTDRWGVWSPGGASF